MGHMCDHAIIVSSFSAEHLEAAHVAAVDLFGPLVTPVVEGVANGHRSFMVAPDGSKEFWPTSDEHDVLRDRFVDWLRSPGRPGFVRWVEVQFADDDDMTLIVRHSDEFDDD